MIGQNFSINATNIGHAALREAAIATDSPIDARLAALSESAEEQVGILVEREGFRQALPISEKRVRACIDAEGMDETLRYVGELATQIRVAVRAGLA